MATTTIERPRSKRNGNKKLGPVLVSATRLSVHFGVNRAYIDTLVQQSVIERNAQGLYDQDQSRLKYFAHLRSERTRSPRSTADVEHTAVKTEMLKLRLMEKRGQLRLQSEVDETVDSLLGLILTRLGAWPIRVAGNDLVQRRKAEAVLFELRTELANECQAIGEKRGEPDLEPPLD